MGDFIERDSFVRFFFLNQEFSILNVGYHDFNMTKPLYVYRTQDFYTWHFVLSGSGTLDIYDRSYHINSGEMFFIPPDAKMRYYPDPDSPWEYVWLAVKSDMIKEYSEMVGFSPEKPVCGNQNFTKIRVVLKKLFDLLLAGEGGQFSVLAAFFEIMEICTAKSIPSEIQQVKKVLDESFATPDFSINQLASDVGISHAHLLRRFKEVYGITLIKYIIDKRVQFACELLRTTDLPIRSVAYSCGFTDELHFMKTFKKEIGKSALRYRKEIMMQSQTE